MPKSLLRSFVWLLMYKIRLVSSAFHFSSSLKLPFQMRSLRLCIVCPGEDKCSATENSLTRCKIVCLWLLNEDGISSSFLQHNCLQCINAKEYVNYISRIAVKVSWVQFRCSAWEPHGDRGTDMLTYLTASIVTWRVASGDKRPRNLATYKIFMRLGGCLKDRRGAFLKAPSNFTLTYFKKFLTEIKSSEKVSQWDENQW